MEKEFKDYSLEDILFNIDLYEVININMEYNYESYVSYEAFDGVGYKFDTTDILYSHELAKLVNFILSNKKIYNYCPFCKKYQTLQLRDIEINSELGKRWLASYYDKDEDSEETMNDVNDRLHHSMEIKISELQKYKFLNKKLVCSYDETHMMDFIYHINIWKQEEKYLVCLSKIGQYPSLVDFSIENYKKYEPILTKINAFKDYKKSIELATHGYGIGAYTYMRRILEKLIYFTYDRVKDELGVNQADFKLIRMKDKLKTLEKYLPEMLIENPHIYSILSAGIHGLEEKDCKKIFPVVRQAIDIIINSEIIRLEEEKQKENVAKLLNDAHMDILQKLTD
jgi:hypothetical protein